MYSREKNPAFLIIQKHKEKNVESENCKKDLRAKVYKSLFQNVCIKIFLPRSLYQNVYINFYRNLLE